MKSFPQTRWSVILNAHQDDPDALAELCQAYWYPLYGYARRSGLKPEDAEDLTQAFFEKLLAREFFQTVRPERGRLRSLLLSSMKHFATDEWRRQSAQKRGASRVVEMDAFSAEQRLAIEGRDNVTPEVEFDRCWAREILRLAREKLKEAYEAAGKGKVFEMFQNQLVTGVADRPYHVMARELGLTESVARVNAFKLRQRYRRYIEETIADTVETAEDAAEELAYLQNLFDTPGG